MSATPASRPSRLEISWEPSPFKDTTYGMVGNVKLFSIKDEGYYKKLRPRVPDHQGVLYREQEFTDPEEAKKCADEILREFMVDLLAERTPGKQSS
ncbi:hypothetical protein [Nonomuraea lactucae]|uniref:hypothetical protein n=1 Tax=Nonomuraea lactucae TaxID=2249762 RepID=UPI000DE1D6FD|nr:hypothetical protein [Nonomuraea lactucae]